QRHGDKEAPRRLDAFLGWTFLGELLAALLRGAPLWCDSLILAHGGSIRQPSGIVSGDGAARCAGLNMLRTGILRCARNDGEFAARQWRLRNMSVAFLGPRGTNSEEAALQFGGENANLKEFGNFAAVLTAVETGLA